jgi:hypothetical protein
MFSFKFNYTLLDQDALTILPMLLLSSFDEANQSNQMETRTGDDSLS